MAEILAGRLLEAGGDVNFTRMATTNAIKKLKNRDKSDQRSQLLKHATAHRNYKMVQVLTRYADQESKDEALAASVTANYISLTEFLMRHGASTAALETEFESLVKSKEFAMVTVILKGTQPVSKDLASRCLHKAVCRSVGNSCCTARFRSRCEPWGSSGLETRHQVCP